VTIDPVALAVIQNSLMQVADEMDLVHERTAFSPVVSEGLDRANGLYRAGTGEVIVQGRRGLPLFVGVMQDTVAAVIASDCRAGPDDIVLLNDPYAGGTHLMDVKCVRPFHYNGRLWCYLANSAHWSDVGGAVPGGFASGATEIHQEGLRITPIRIVKDGRYDEELVAMLMANCRVPEERIGDLYAQIGALLLGERRLRELLDRFGAETVTSAIDELDTRAERHMRRYIADIPDGEHAFDASLDSDGIDDRPLTVRLRMRVSGSELHFDLSESDPPCRGPLNAPWATTKTAVYIAVMHCFPDVPINAGCLRPIRVARPRGTFLDAAYPMPVSGASAEVSQRVCETALGALGLALPARAYGGACGTVCNLTIGGYDEQQERSYVLYYYAGGGYGGHWLGDGQSNGCNLIAYAKTQPVEVLERNFPVMFDCYELRPDSAGPGRERGGLGVHYRIRVCRGSGTASFMMDKGRFAPFGIQGGLSSVPTEITIGQRGSTTRPAHLTKGSGYVLQTGDWIDVRTPGGGGRGPVQERDRLAVRRDLRHGYISEDAARSVYGLAPEGKLG
jgi:N-methylhydantoinase B